MIFRPEREISVTAQRLGRMHGEERVIQRLPADRDQIRITRLQDGLGLGAIEDEAHGHGVHRRLAPHLGGEGHLEAGVAGDDRRGGRTGQPARGAIHHIHAQRLQRLGQRHRVAHVPAALRAIERGDAEEERLMGGPDLANRLGDLKREAHPPSQVAAIAIIAGIGDGREEGGDEIAMRAMHLGDIKARRIGAARGGDEIGDDAGNAALAQHRRRDPIGADRLARHAHHRPGVVAAGDIGGGQRAIAGKGGLHRALAAGMGELDGGHAALGLEEAGDALEAGDLAIMPQANIAIGDPAGGLHRAGLGEDGAGAAEGEFAVMGDVEIIHLAILGAVLHHGRDDDAVGQGDAAQGERGEQHGLGCHDLACSSGRFGAWAPILDQAGGLTRVGAMLVGGSRATHRGCLALITEQYPRRGFGRSGGIRTHDPQSPRLVRYQTALRSGVGDGLGEVPPLVQCAGAGDGASSPRQNKP